MIEFCLWNHTYDGTKARERLGFEPKVDFEAVLESAVKWELKRREEIAMAEQKQN